MPGGLALWLALVCLGTPAQALELIMFQKPGCPWCEAWDEEVGIAYPNTDEARQAPLRRVDITDEIPEDLKEIKAVNFTPTFVLFDSGREIGRISGYPGAEFFWFLLDEILAKANQK